MYLILATQLLITTGGVLFIYNNENAQLFMKENIWLLWVCIALTFVLTMLIFYIDHVARSVPTNYIALLAFTLCESYLAGFITSTYDPSTVSLAFGLTCVIVISLTIYAWTTKTDFTMMGGILFMGLGLLIVGSIIGIFYRDRIFRLILSIFCVFLFGLYLIYDTQLIVGKKRNAL